MKVERSEQGKGLCLSPVVGVDVGGTRIAAAVVNAAGRCTGRVRRPIDISTEGATIASIAGAIRDAMTASGVAFSAVCGIGIGLNGDIDGERGMALQAANLPWHDTPLVAVLQNRLGLPVRIENDVKTAALGEYRFGAARGRRNAAYLSLGTRVAAAFIVNGQLLRGSTQMAGEIGHAMVVPDGPECKCGGRGCLEALVASPGIAVRAVKALEEAGIRPTATITAEWVFDAAAAGDGIARRVLDETAVYYGVALRWLSTILNPEIVVIGGGIAGHGAMLIDALRVDMQRQAAESSVARKALTPEMLVLPELGQDAGILGAAALIEGDR